MACFGGTVQVTGPTATITNTPSPTATPTPTPDLSFTPEPQPADASMLMIEMKQCVVFLIAFRNVAATTAALSCVNLASPNALLTVGALTSQSDGKDDAIIHPVDGRIDLECTSDSNGDGIVCGPGALCRRPASKWTTAPGVSCQSAPRTAPGAAAVQASPPQPGCLGQPGRVLAAFSCLSAISLFWLIFSNQLKMIDSARSAA